MLFLPYSKFHYHFVNYSLNVTQHRVPHYLRYHRAHPSVDIHVVNYSNSIFGGGIMVFEMLKDETIAVALRSFKFLASINDDNCVDLFAFLVKSVVTITKTV